MFVDQIAEGPAFRVVMCGGMCMCVQWRVGKAPDNFQTRSGSCVLAGTVSVAPRLFPATPQTEKFKCFAFLFFFT